MEVKFGIESTHRMWYVKKDYQDLSENLTQGNGIKDPD